MAVVVVVVAVLVDVVVVGSAATTTTSTTVKRRWQRMPELYVWCRYLYLPRTVQLTGVRLGLSCWRCAQCERGGLLCATRCPTEVRSAPLCVSSPSSRPYRISAGPVPHAALALATDHGRPAATDDCVTLISISSIAQPPSPPPPPPQPLRWCSAAPARQCSSSRSSRSAEPRTSWVRCAIDSHSRQL